MATTRNMRSCPVVFCDAAPHPDPSFRVKSGLSISPSDVKRMTEHGIASSPVGLNFLEGVENPSYDMPTDALRGIDAAEIWEAEQDARRKLRANLTTASEMFNGE